MSSILGLAGILYSLYFTFNAPHSGFTGFLDIPAIVLVGLCPPCIMLLSHTIFDFLTGIKLLLWSSFMNSRRIQREIINSLSQCSAKVRSDGIGSLLNMQNQLGYDLLRDGIAMIVNDFTTDEIRHNLQAKIQAKQGHLALANNLFENLSKACPGVGMIGTLLGLITMLSNMQDPAKIGAGMATAMVTTLYGLLLGTIIYAPWAERIHLEAEKILEIDMLVLEGVLHLKERKSSLHLKNLVKTFGKDEAKAKGA